MSDQEKDPVVHSSLSKPLFISSALLVLSMVWGLYDEVYGIRPWKGYQARFVEALLALPEDSGGRARRTSRSRSRRRPNTSGWTPRCRLPRRPPCRGASAIDKKINQELVPQDPGAERSLPGSAQPHRRRSPTRSRSSHSESSKNSLRKEIEELTRRSTMSSLPGECAEAQHGLQGHDATSFRRGRTRRPNCCSSAWT